MSLTLITPPAVEPVSLHEQKEWLNLESEVYDDSLIVRNLESCREEAEKETGRAFITQTWQLKVDSFQDTIWLPKPPTQSITSIKYIDEDGAEQTLNASVYTLVTRKGLSRIELAYDQSWPAIRSQYDAVTVTYVAGYGDEAADVPGGIKDGIKVMATDRMENRESTAVVPRATLIMTASANLLQPYKVELYG